MEELTIGEVARRAGLRTSALRFYERSGLLPLPARRGGQRRYDAHVLPRVAAIQAAQAAGFTLAEIRTLLDGFPPEVPPGERWRALAARKIAELDELIASAEQMKRRLAAGADCACAGYEVCPLLAASPTAAPRM
ncbi:MAG TPA: MerR family transcriptional regulator [Roseiflexaceae bacterium]|nr:MerR family transcriptional regulator [Roseiflexaceae bacterium]